MDAVLSPQDRGQASRCGLHGYRARRRQETVLHGSIKQGEGSLRGIGGGTRTTGVKEFYVGLAGENGERVPTKTASTSEDPALERVLQRQCILL